MADSDNALQSSKKRAAGRELSRDNPGLDDEEDTLELETGTFKRASDDVLATRRIVKVRRNQTASTPSNPFAGIRLVPHGESGASITAVNNDSLSVGRDDGKDVTPIDSGKDNNEDEKQPEIEETAGEDTKEVSGAKLESTSETSNDPFAGGEEAKSETLVGGDKMENENNKEEKSDNVIAERRDEGTPFSSFQQLSNSQNAFTGLAGTGFSSSTFSFGSVGSAPTNGTGLNTGFSFSSNGNSSHFTALGTSIVSKNEGSPSMQAVAVENGEENERVAFTADSVLFEFVDGGWKDSGKGELRVNVSSIGTEKARLLMRAKGNYRLILNAGLYPELKLTNMEKRGITFACMNCASESKDGLSTFALKFKDGSVVEHFRAAVTRYKGHEQAPPAVRTPENSPKATED